MAIAKTSYEGGQAGCEIIASKPRQIIDRSSNTVVRTIPVGKNPQGVATTGDGKFVYVVSHGSNSVSVIAKGNAPAPGQPPSYKVVATINGVMTLPLAVAISRP